MSGRTLFTPFGIDSGLGEARTFEDHPEHVAQMIRQVLLTGPGERICRPRFGAGVRSLVFEPNGQVSETLAKVAIQQALEIWLGSVIVVDRLKVTAQQETLSIDLAYRLISRGERQYLNVEVTL